MIGMMIVSGYLFKKIPEKPVSIRAFEPPWGKRKAPVFVSKAGTYYGGEGEIRTLERFYPLHDFQSCINATSAENLVFPCF